MKNIREENGKILCDFYPEDCNEACLLIYDKKSGEVKCDLPEAYKYCMRHIASAQYWINKNIKNGLPKEHEIVWG